MVLITLGVINIRLSTIPLQAMVLILLSGAIGIGLGDSVYLEALRILGPRRTTLLKVLAPVFAGLIAWIFMHEELTLRSWGGIALCTFGVAWVQGERIPQGDLYEPGKEGEAKKQSSPISRGILFGVLAALGDATAVVLSHAALTQSSLDPLWSTLLRLSAGLVVVTIIIGVRRQPLGAWHKNEHPLRLIAWTLVAVFFGTFLGIWLQQKSLQTTAAGIAQTLISTSPLFVIPAAALMGEKVSLRSVLGVVIALGGVALLMIK
jgi:drug/metabolite transporter (DMT)-like permease